MRNWEGVPGYAWRLDFLKSLENEVRTFSDQSALLMPTFGDTVREFRGDNVPLEDWESHAERRDVVVIDGITTRGRTTRREVGAGARDPGAHLENIFFVVASSHSGSFVSISSTRNTSLSVLLLVPSLKVMPINTKRIHFCSFVAFYPPAQLYLFPTVCSCICTATSGIYCEEPPEMVMTWPVNR